MLNQLLRLCNDERGSYYVEVALVIIVLVFAVAGDLANLGSTTGGKVGEIQTKVSEVGTP